MIRPAAIALCAAMAFATPALAEPLSKTVETKLGWVMDATSALSDRLFFDPVARAQASLSDTVLAQAIRADRALEDEGLIMPSSDQLTGPLEATALRITDVACAAGDFTFGAVQAMRDGAKGMFVTGATTMAAMGEGIFDAPAPVTR